MTDSITRKIVTREVALLTALLFVGLVIMPVALYWLGQKLLGQFGGYGYADFYGTLTARFRNGDSATWFLVLSPYLAWQALRLTAWAWRHANRSAP
ncbi:MAG: hypothetical protein GWN47_11640 [Woeseiaceae bacterium]|nr:hypothetical protein [Woeseiaceae bacterium]